MSLVLKAILEAIAGSFFSAIADMIKDSFARQDQIALGKATERAEQATEAIEVKDAMTKEQLRPRDAGEVEDRLSKGSF